MNHASRSPSRPITPHASPGPLPLRLRAVLLHMMLFAVALGPIFAAAAAADTRPLQVAGSDHLGDLPTVIAEQEQLFTRHGLDIIVETGQSGSQNLGRLRSGEVDFALMALTPLVLDALADPSPRGPDDPVIIANLLHSLHLNHVVVPQAGPVREPADLIGRRIGLRKSTNAEFAWWLFAHFHGLDPDAVTQVDYPVTRINEALQAGEVHGALVWEPWFSRLQEGSDQAFHSLPGSNLYAAKWVLVTTRATAREQPERCRALLAAYRQAIAAIKQDPEAAIAVYAAHAGVDAAILQRNWDALDYELNLRWSILAGLQQQLDWAMVAGHEWAQQALSVFDFVDASALQALDPSLVGLPGSMAAPEPGP